jgi:hypothetical protein
VVTIKSNGSDIDVFGVTFSGGLSVRPVVKPDPFAVPFV